jgi:SAM-dependent methyltransferase
MKIITQVTTQVSIPKHWLSGDWDEDIILKLKADVWNFEGKHTPVIREITCTGYQMWIVNSLNYFDVVISSDVIEHLFYPKELARFAKQCLKPNGQLIVTTPYHGYWKNLALALLNAMDRHHSVLWDGGHIKFFSVKTLSQLLNEEGFNDIQFKFAGRLPYLWKGMLASARLS